MDNEVERMQESLVSIASELFRFRRVFEKAISKLDLNEQNKYSGQFLWFTKKVDEAMSESNFKIINLESKLYDPGMAVTPLNIDEFDVNDVLYVKQMVEPVILKDNNLIKMGTVILGRVEQ